MTVAIAITAETATEAAEQQYNDDDDEDHTKHDVILFLLGEITPRLNALFFVPSQQSEPIPTLGGENKPHELRKIPIRRSAGRIWAAACPCPLWSIRGILLHALSLATAFRSQISRLS